MTCGFPYVVSNSFFPLEKMSEANVIICAMKVVQNGISFTMLSMMTPQEGLAGLGNSSDLSVGPIWCQDVMTQSGSHV